MQLHVSFVKMTAPFIKEVEKDFRHLQAFFVAVLQFDLPH